MNLPHALPFAAAPAPTGYDGAGIDGPAYLDVVRAAQDAPGWLDRAVGLYSSYGLAVFAVLMLYGWWRARVRGERERAVRALAAPLLTVLAFVVSTLVKSAVRELRPCQSLRAVTLEACPAPGDWSFPSNHATIAAAAAIALWFVSARLGVIASVCALAMAASRVWVGVHYPHDVAVGIVVGALVALALGLLVRALAPGLAGRIGPLVRAGGPGRVPGASA
ncbi:phosphatase PAP2 family protein [Streptomyces sp. NPDC048717]|uniref:phosphatase PAP2 family protein n=1 Tax=unclassified Streptomyces TaxID=2593676 RepID=UPI003420B746